MQQSEILTRHRGVGPLVRAPHQTRNRLRELHRICRVAGIPRLSWHPLRHTFATRLVAEGVDVATIQRLLGHSTPTMTMRYTHTSADRMAEAVGRVLG